MPNGKAELPPSLHWLLPAENHILDRTNFELGARLGGQLQRLVSRRLVNIDAQPQSLACIGNDLS